MSNNKIVLCGITGDLAKGKVLPAIYNLFRRELINEQTFIIGTSRQAIDASEIMNTLRQTLSSNNQQAHEPTLQLLERQLSIVQLDPADSAGYPALMQQLATLGNSNESEQLFFYLSLPPQVYSSVIARLGEQKLNHARLLVEKPFGYDLQSAKTLIADTAAHFKEYQIYRIDHYLAKETAQNILTFRSQNPMFAALWSDRHIHRVTITASESIGIQGRSNFYDSIGALRDVIQSHLMQLLSVTLMQVPESLTEAAVHQAKQEVFNALQPAEPSKAVRGQYHGYLEEVDNSSSTTETYASVEIRSSSSQWHNTIFKLQTGKALDNKQTAIIIDFGSDGRNQLTFRIQPHEGITLSMQVKQPGLATQVTTTDLAFDYESTFKDDNPQDAYERVLFDAIRGDRTLFATDTEVLESWRVLQPILNAWQDNGEGLTVYSVGSKSI